MTDQAGTTSWEGIADWKPWRPGEVAAILQDVGIPWCIAGGWALDVWRARETRAHEDIEIAVPRTCFSEIRKHLAEYKLFQVGNGEVHPLKVESLPPPHLHQSWVLDEPARAWRMDIFLEPGDLGTWIFRRDERIRGPRADLVALSHQGLPYLKPEAVLLYKAKAARPKDNADFASCVPFMEVGARAWLRETLRIVHPHHEWLSALS